VVEYSNDGGSNYTSAEPTPSPTVPAMTHLRYRRTAGALSATGPELHPFAPRRVIDTKGRVRNHVGGRLAPPIPWNPEWAGRLRPGGHDPKARLEDMDVEGIEVSVLFPTTGLFFGGIDDLRVQGALCRAYDDWLHDFCAYDRRRLVGAALVPFGDVAASVTELRRAVEQLGFRAVMVRPNPVDGRPLHDPYYDPFWKACEELGVPACIHEGTTQNVVQSGRDRFEDFLFRHACSHPHEQQIACLSFTCGGILERFPRLRVVFLESGCGWLPSWIERLDEHVESWGFDSPRLPLLPSEYFARQCFVSCDPAERGVPAVISLVGDDAIVFASDYPHPDGIFPGVVAALAERDDIAEASKAKILRDNARRLFPLD